MGVSLGRFGIALGGSSKPTLGPDLFPDSPSTFGDPPWSYASRAFTKSSGSGWGGVDNIITAGVAEYEIEVVISGSDQGGSLAVAMTDSNQANANNFPFSGNLADGTYSGRVTTTANNVDLGLFAGGWDGTVTINYLKLVL